MDSKNKIGSKRDPRGSHGARAVATRSLQPLSRVCFITTYALTLFPQVYREIIYYLTSHYIVSFRLMIYFIEDIVIDRIN